jgi:hypothetical protein
MEGMVSKYQEWLKQADYDMDTADAMYSSVPAGRP